MKDHQHDCNSDSAIERLKEIGIDLDTPADAAELTETTDVSIQAETIVYPNPPEMQGDKFCVLIQITLSHIPGISEYVLGRQLRRLLNEEAARQNRYVIDFTPQYRETVSQVRMQAFMSGVIR